MGLMTPIATEAIASPNIALIKYWGNRDHELRLPANDSLSMTLGGLETRVRMALDPALDADRMVADSRPITGEPLERVSRFLQIVRQLSGRREYASIETWSNFPQGVGIASSAAAFAALAVAADAAYGLGLDRKSLSRLARRGSGSAARSVFGGFVRLRSGQEDAAAFAEPILGAGHWGLVDLIAIVSTSPKEVGSSKGHRLAETSPLQKARVEDTPRRFDLCMHALLARDFQRLATIVQQDSDLMHAVMMTSTPPLHYWEPATLAIMKTVLAWQAQGLQVAYTVDAGPNVHCLCPAAHAEEIQARLQAIPGVQTILCCHPGQEARLLIRPGAG